MHGNVAMQKVYNAAAGKAFGSKWLAISNHLLRKRPMLGRFR